jgi:endonuclease/exonuclease/phosphatase family metal-dependent hydrolase
MRVLTWNLFHGRSVPGARRSLLDDFGAALAGWEWDVALLQEVPPWWPGPLARACDADGRAALTSRNFGLSIRRSMADRWPDLMKSNGGGANAILVRFAFGGIARHAAQRVRRWPERRVVHAVQLGSGAWVGNVHASTHPEARVQEDLARAGSAVAGWAGDDGGAALLGGDCNVAAPAVPGFVDLGGHGIDRFLVREGDGLAVAEAARPLEHAPLSDHAPVVIAVS